MARAWYTFPAIQYQGFSGLSCPAVALCVAADHPSVVFSISDPGSSAPATAMENVSGPFGEVDYYGVSCPSVSFCAAIGRGFPPMSFLGVPAIATTTDPTNAASWTVSQLDDSFDPLPATAILACPSSSLCMYGSRYRLLMISHNPTGGAGTWVADATVDSYRITALSCPSVSFCMGVDDHGRAVTSTNPDATIPTWTLTNVFDATGGSQGSAPPSAPGAGLGVQPPPHKARCRVPNVLGKRLRSAKTAITKAHCQIGRITRTRTKPERHRKVLFETPRAGKLVPAGTKVRLVVGK